jgi:hypothetical protein
MGEGSRKSASNSTLLYVVLVIIGFLGGMPFFGVAFWLLRELPPSQDTTAPALVSEDAQPKTQASASPETLSTDELTSTEPEPSPYAHILNSAAIKAESAQNISHSAFTASDWALIVTRWQEAIQLLEQIPEWDEFYGEAQQRREGYLLALSYAQQGRTIPDASAIFSEAVNAATQASWLTQIAVSSNDWRKVALKWQQASDLMSQVPSFADNYSIAQEKAIEYARSQSYAQSQANRPVVPIPVTTVASPTPLPFPSTPSQPVVPIPTTAFSPPLPSTSPSPLRISTPTSGSGGSLSDSSIDITGQSPSSSSSSGNSSGNCDYPWQYDSAGRRCGDRAASVREGGRLGGTGSSSSSSSSPGSNCHYVSSYTRSDGTRVSGYTRCR